MINWQAYLPHDVATQLSRWERCCLAAAEIATHAVLQGCPGSTYASDMLFRPTNCHSHTTDCLTLQSSCQLQRFDRDPGDACCSQMDTAECED